MLLVLDDAPRLSLFCDLVSTRVYPRLDRHLAVSVGGVDDPDLVNRSAWVIDAAKVDVKSGYVLDLVTVMADSALDVAADVARAFRVANGSSAALELVASRYG